MASRCFGPSDFSGVAEIFSTSLRTTSSIINHARSSPLEEAYEAIQPWVKSGAVSRLAEITHLDRLGIPNYYAVRPSAQDPNCVIASGKGVTNRVAVLSALYESFERWAAEVVPPLVCFESRTDLALTYPGIRIACPPSLPHSARLSWCVGFDLISSGPCFVPLRKAMFPNRADTEEETMLDSSTDGLSAGTCLLEAVVNGLFEIIERDAVARVNPLNLNRLDSSGLQGENAILIKKFAASEMSFLSTSVPRQPESQSSTA